MIAGGLDYEEAQELARRYGEQWDAVKRCGALVPVPGAEPRPCPRKTDGGRCARCASKGAR